MERKKFMERATSEDTHRPLGAGGEVAPGGKFVVWYCQTVICVTQDGTPVEHDLDSHVLYEGPSWEQAQAALDTQPKSRFLNSYEKRWLSWEPAPKGDKAD